MNDLIGIFYLSILWLGILIFLFVLTATRHDFLWKHFIALIFFSNMETAFAFAFAFVVNYHFLLCSHFKDQQLCMRSKVGSFYKIRVAFWWPTERVSLVIQFHLFRFWVLLRYSNWKTKQTIWQEGAMWGMHIF